MIFELINPSDKCTFEAPNLKIAALVRAKVASVLSTQKAIVPQATTKAKPSLNNQNRLLTNVTPFKQPLNTPNPQEVVVVNQNNGNIGQNVSDRFLAHALTGGIGMGKLDV